MIKSRPVKLREDTIAKFPVLAYDPGLSIGKASVFVLDADKEVQYLMASLETQQWPDDYLKVQVGMTLANTVVVEDFKLYPNRAKSLVWDSLEAVRCLGWIQGCAMAAGIWDPTNQTMAAQAKAVSKDDLAALWYEGDLPLKHKERHMLDAIRHFHVWLLRQAKDGRE